jgi:hypothetical protein
MKTEKIHWKKYNEKILQWNVWCGNTEILTETQLIVISWTYVQSDLVYTDISIRVDSGLVSQLFSREFCGE